MSSLPTGRYCLIFPCGPEVLVSTGIGRGPQSISRTRLRTYTRTRAHLYVSIPAKNGANYTPLHSNRWFSIIRGCIVGLRNYTPTVHQPFTKNCRRHGPNSPHPRHRKRARRGDCRTGLSRNVNAKSTDLVFGKKCIIFALLRSGLAANARLLRCFFAVYDPPKGLEGRLAGSTW